VDSAATCGQHKFLPNPPQHTTAATIVATFAGADVGFIRNGPFEACLNGAYTDWLRHQAELLVNEDKRAQSLNDASVAAWTLPWTIAARRERPVQPPLTTLDATWCGGETTCSTTRKVFGGAGIRTNLVTRLIQPLLPDHRHQRRRPASAGRR
jgi:hypothetical protein